MVRKGELWTAEEDKFVIEHPDLPIRQMAEALDRTYDGTRMRRIHVLNLRKGQMSQPDDEQKMRRWRTEYGGTA